MIRTRTLKKTLAIALALVMTLAISVHALAVTITSWNPNTDAYNTTTLDGESYGAVYSQDGIITYNLSDQNGTQDTYTNRQSGDPTADDRRIETGSIYFNPDGWSYEKTLYNTQGVPYSTTTTTGSHSKFNLQSILAKGEGASNILSITFSTGTYYIFGPFRHYSYTTLKAAPGATPVFRKSSSKYVFINTDDSTSGITAYNGSYGFHLQGITFDCNSLTANVVKSTHANFYTIENCTFRNGTVAHVIELNSMKNSTVSGCTFENIRTAPDGTYLTYENMATKLTDYNEEVIQIEGDSSQVHTSLTQKWGRTITVGQNSFTSAPLSHDNTVSLDVTVTNCTFRNILRGVGHHYFNSSTNVYQTNIAITNNTFETVLHHAVHLQGYKNVTITGNKFYQISSPSLGADQGNRIHLKTCVNSSGTAYGSSMVTTLAGTNYYKNSLGNWVLLTNNTTDQRIVVEN